MQVKNRVKKHLEFQEIISKGKLEKTNSLSMYFVKNTLGYTRIGISVPKKSGNAVVRNKIKRQIRAICAQTANYEKSFDLILIVRKAYNINNFDIIKNEISELFNKIG